MAMAHRQLLTSTCSVVAAVFCLSLLIMSSSAAAAAAAQPTATTTQPALPNAGVPPAAATSSEVVVPSAGTAAPAAAAAVASKKFPLDASPEEYVPAAEVASALPVPIPDQFPGKGWLGGLGQDQTFPNGYPAGLGGPGGFGGVGPGGFGNNVGPGTFGYNGPLYFGSAPRRAGLCALAVLMPLLSILAIYALT